MQPVYLGLKIGFITVSHSVAVVVVPCVDNQYRIFGGALLFRGVFTCPYGIGPQEGNALLLA
jgi:hypothetical protein